MRSVEHQKAVFVVEVGDTMFVGMNVAHVTMVANLSVWATVHNAFRVEVGSRSFAALNEIAWSVKRE